MQLAEFNVELKAKIRSGNAEESELSALKVLQAECQSALKRRKTAA